MRYSTGLLSIALAFTSFGCSKVDAQAVLWKSYLSQARQTDAVHDAEKYYAMAFQELLSTKEEDTNLFPIAIEIAQFGIAHGNMALADKYAQIAARHIDEGSPKICAFYHTQGRLAQLKNHLSEAESWYRKALIELDKKAPDFQRGRTLQRLAETYVSMKKIEASKVLFCEAAELTYRQANTKEEEQIAIEVAKEMVDLWPKDAIPLIWLGRDYVLVHKFDLAERAIIQALTYSPDSYDARYAMAECLDRQNRVPEAIAAYSRVLDTRQSPALFIFRGDLYRRSESYSEAKRDFEAALKLDPVNQYAMVLLAQINIIMGSYTEAIDRLSYVILKDGNNSRARAARARAYFLTHRTQLALEDVNTAIQHDPDGQAYWVRSKIYMALGRTKEAFADLESCLVKEPNDLRTRLEVADNYYREHQYQKVLDTLAPIKEPDDGMLCLKGIALRSLRRNAEAEDAFRAAIAKNPVNRQAQQNYSELLEQRSSK